MNMKKWCLFLTLYACACLLAACAAAGANGGADSLSTGGAGRGVCGVPGDLGAEDGTLVLAEQGNDAGLYTVTPAEQALTLDGAAFDPGGAGSISGSARRVPGGDHRDGDL